MDVNDEKPPMVVFLENLRAVEFPEHPDGSFEQRRDRAVQVARLRGHRGTIVEKRFFQYTCAKCGAQALIADHTEEGDPAFSGLAMSAACPNRHIP